MGTQMLGAVEVEPVEPEEEREIQHVWHFQSVTLLDSRYTLCLFATTPISPSHESGNLLNMIMDSGAEEHVVSQTGKVWVSQCGNLLKFDCAVRLVTTWEFLAVLLCVDGVIIKWWS